MTLEEQKTVKATQELMEKPLYQHDCTNCIFLGGKAFYDFYFCPQGGTPTVIARYGNDPWEYRSGLNLLEYDRELKVAYILAKNKGLIKGTQHDSRRP